MKFVLKTIALLLILKGCSSAQIPAGFVQTTGTVSALANGSFAGSWTNLSGISQLPLLGGQSTFQQTVNGRLDSNGHFSVLLADTAQIIPNPSTWTLSFTFACPVTAPTNGGFSIQVAVTGGGGTEDITAQITAALPSNPCAGGGGGGTTYPGVTSDGNLGLTIVGSTTAFTSSSTARGKVLSNQFYIGSAVPLSATQQAYAGGRDSTLEESRLISFNNTQTANTIGTSWAMNTTQHCYSPGDCIPYLSGTDSVGVSAEQNEGMDLHISLAEQGEVSGGTLSASACAVSCTVNIAQTYGTANAWGDGSALIDLTGSYNTGAISNISSPQVTGTGTNWDGIYGTTYAVATTTAAVNNPGSVNSFPRTNVTISIGSVTGTGFTANSQVACAFDNNDSSWQSFHITAIGSGTITVDQMGWPLTSGAIVVQGGLSCYGFGMDVDTVSPGNLNGMGNETDQQVTGTIRQVRPIVSNQAGNILTVYANASGEAQFNTRAGQGALVSGAGAYHIYPQARVLSVFNATSGTVNGSGITTTPTAGTFSVSDTVEQPHYFAAKNLGIDLLQNGWQSQPGWNQGIGVHMTGTAAVGGYEEFLEIGNSPNVYAGQPTAVFNPATNPGYGTLNTMGGIFVQGPHQSGLAMNYPPFGTFNAIGGLVIGCGGTSCVNWNAPFPVLNVQNQGSFSGIHFEDILGYNPVTYTWNMTSHATGVAGGTPACTLTFGPAGLSQAGSCASGGLANVARTNVANTFTLPQTISVGSSTQNGLTLNGLSPQFRLIDATSGNTGTIGMNTTGGGFMGSGVPTGGGYTWFIGATELASWQSGGLAFMDNIANANGVVIPSTDLGPHGTDHYIQKSDATGTSGHLAIYDSNGGLTDGGAPATGILTGTLTFTTATSDAATITGVTGSSVCVFAPTNATAAANTTIAYVSAVSTNTVTITHVATTASGGTANIVCK